MEFLRDWGGPVGDRQTSWRVFYQEITRSSTGARRSILFVLKGKNREEVRELRHVTSDATLNKAFQLAHSIYRYRTSDRKTALKIVTEALTGLGVRLTAQHEANRHDPQRPTKVRWSTAQWFQILIYYKSEEYERQQEAQARISLSEEDMIIRYIKHLILKTCRRNSFHISLGLGRLLYDYRAGDTMAIYDFIFQDPDSSTKKADAYYRARKNKLIEEMKRRFAHSLRIDQGARGEKRFQSQEDSSQFNELAMQYLTRFTPWETRCELPKQLDTWTAVRSLQFNQATQIHSLIHPICFSRITDALKLDPPERRLALPKFFLADRQSDDPADNTPTSSELTEVEATEIRDRISEDKLRRKKFVPGSLLVLADGIECARLHLAQSSQTRCDLEEGATLIELVGCTEESEVLLATHVITYEEDEPLAGQSQEYSIVLEGGQKISLMIVAPQASDDFASSIEITYQETRAIRAFMLWLRQLIHRLFKAGMIKRWRGIPIPTPAMGMALIVLAGLVVILYLVLSTRPNERIAKQQPPVLSSERAKIPSTGPSPTLNATPQQTPPSTGKREPSISGQRSKPGSTTRDQTEGAVKALLDVQRIYVESLGADPFSQAVRQKLIAKLQAGHSIVITNSPDEADTAVSGSVRSTGKRRNESTGQEIEVGNVALKLVNVSGDVIWRSKTYRGTASEIADQFAEDLREAIERERQRQKNKR